MPDADDLELPNVLGGAWEHALFLSFGLDLPFYERALAGQLPASCRNRILLGDERTYLASCDHYADSGLVQHANRRYVAEPILRRAPSHGKVVLLTAADAGRLLVGSGNVSLQGYGSGGELFTRYEYGGVDHAHLAEFVAVRRAARAAARRRPADPHGRMARRPAARRARRGSSASAGDRGVRHNLDRSFSDQLVDAVAERAGRRAVDVRAVLRPRRRGPASLVRRLQPRRTVLLVQPRRTAIDPGGPRAAAAESAALEVRASRGPPTATRGCTRSSSSSGWRKRRSASRARRTRPWRRWSATSRRGTSRSRTCCAGRGTPSTRSSTAWIGEPVADLGAARPQGARDR